LDSRRPRAHVLAILFATAAVASVAAVAILGVPQVRLSRSHSFCTRHHHPLAAPGKTPSPFARHSECAAPSCRRCSRQTGGAAVSVLVAVRGGAEHRRARHVQGSAASGHLVELLGADGVRDFARYAGLSHQGAVSMLSSMAPLQMLSSVDSLDGDANMAKADKYLGGTDGEDEEATPPLLPSTFPPWIRVEGKSLVNIPQMPSLRGGICMGVD